jgi:hypothetical protein
MENIRQLRQFAGPFSRIHMNALLSPINSFDADASDDALVRHAIDKMFGIIKTTTPFNFLRKWVNGGGRDLSGSLQTLQEIGKGIKDEFPMIGEFLQSGNLISLEDINAEISGVVNDLRKKHSLQNVVEAMCDIVSLKKYSYFDKDKDNTHSRIAINMKLVSYAARKGILGENLKNIAVDHSYCKSGKDRTQIIEIGTTIKALNQELEINEKSQQLQALRSLLSADQASTMAGVQGGSLGCYGIKSGTAQDASESIFKEVRSYFTPKTASDNRFTVNQFEVKNESVKTQVKQIKKKIDELLNKNVERVKAAVFSKKNGISR